ncbi:MAG: single-stranded-DNA-specific exonuclease RecJ [Acidobacteria bacterium]|nr:single-stranded-DNA-specific exonuclease RecJ [Acidobacteriota bacterium]
MRWNLPHPAAEEIHALGAELKVGAPAAQVLWNRGYRDPAAARTFLEAPIEGMHDPWLLKDMDKAVERLLAAIRAKQPILLYGDYDVDGTSSVVILKKAIEIAGGVASFHVPHRLLEGYGMRSDVVEEAAARGVKLIVSVDTGIRAAEVVKHAVSVGIDVIITDHHLPEGVLPPATAVLNPNRPDCTYPEKSLCGAGVALKLIHALLIRLEYPPERVRALLESFLKMAAIATVADVVPLTGENRIIVKRGLAGLHTVRNAGLRALLEVAGLTPGSTPSAGQVAFRIAPRINAAGRMATATDVIDLFTTDDPQRAKTLAAELHRLNQERQEAEAEITRAILKLCEESPVTADQYALVFSGAGWHRGVVGIVASRIVERFHRPTIVLSEEDGEAQGSGRSIRPFHLLDALESMPDLFTRFGGHRQAVGLGLPIERIQEFRERFNRYAAERLTPEDLIPTLDVDGVVRFAELNDESAAEVLSLAPFGFGNPTPVFAVRGAEVTSPADVFSEKHLKVRMRQSGRGFRITAWNFAERAFEFEPGSVLDAAVTVVDDPYSAARGYPPWSLELKDVRSSRAGAGG